MTTTTCVCRGSDAFSWQLLQTSSEPFWWGIRFLWLFWRACLHKIRFGFLSPYMCASASFLHTSSFFHTCVRVREFVQVYMRAHLFICVRAWKYVELAMCTCVRVCVRACACVRVCTRARLFIYVRVRDYKKISKARIFKRRIWLYIYDDMMCVSYDTSDLFTMNLRIIIHMIYLL